MSVYLDLTNEFNAGRLRAIVSSGNAVALLRLAIASKDGDWILREDQEALDHVLGVLEARGARYRFGAPLDLRWLQWGWSSHFQFAYQGLRVRTDFFIRPPRIAAPELAALWREQEGRELPFTGPGALLRMKQTARAKDWPIASELARLLPDAREQMLHSRSARDLIELARREPALVVALASQRPALAAIDSGRDELRMALERERFAAMDADERRMRAYLQAARALESAWPVLEQQTAGMPLRLAHEVLVGCAERCLPIGPIATSS